MITGFGVFVFFFPSSLGGGRYPYHQLWTWDTGIPLAWVVFCFPFGIWIGKEKLGLGFETVEAAKVKQSTQCLCDMISTALGDVTILSVNTGCIPAQQFGTVPWTGSVRNPNLQTLLSVIIERPLISRGRSQAARSRRITAYTWRLTFFRCRGACVSLHLTLLSGEEIAEGGSRENLLSWLKDHHLLVRVLIICRQWQLIRQTVDVNWKSCSVSFEKKGTFPSASCVPPPPHVSPSQWVSSHSA